MKKATFTSRSGGIKSLPCRECGRTVDNVDTNATRATCWRCVSKSINPGSVIVSDLDDSEMADLIRKIKTTENGGSEN